MAAGLKREAAAPEGAKSWFGALDLGESTLELGSARPPRHEPGHAADDARWPGHPMRRASDRQETGFARLLRAFLAARALLGIALLGTELMVTWFGSRPQRELMLALCSLYAMAALASWWRRPDDTPLRAPSMRLSRPQWLATVGVDLLIFSILQFVNAGAGGLNYSALLVLPVMTASVLTPRPQALGVAAASALVILASAGLAMGASGDGAVAFTQAGLAALGLFVVSLLAGELSGRLAREELSARGSMELARRQAQLNRLVLEEMQDGVMVVDRRGRVRAANPAARGLLGEPARPASAEPESLALTGKPAWEPLVRAVDRAFADGHWPEAGRDVVLGRADANDAAQGPRSLRLRVRFTRRAASGAPEDYCVLFMEDLRIVQARLRQEKLAAMGRVSVGIAHEIRNPLAAIMQANDLLAEDVATPQQERLTRMVSENAQRLKRIVDDVMELAPGVAPQPVTIDATAQVATIAAEWARTVKLPTADSPLDLQLPAEPLEALFDPEHLRRVLVNLLDNGLRHGSRTAGAVRVRLEAGADQRATLEVASDGEPIGPEVERHLFEPFFSTRSRGTGLGLYICRELCERYGASIEHGARRAGERHRNVFTVSMRRAAVAAGPH
ncbi:MAG TPA: ATP-binding protein [Methylibium sp.]|uniref:sensor histidine kinase n=1 Tax=Methylibium sp. TaxID=2067992 RepID=UPI002DB6C297|nr:ATP-binding protein [Methylibium sp.]HEU4457923.1 ATP-binding protein [Methylibium sp.]